jgi:hypothetical protein
MSDIKASVRDYVHVKNPMQSPAMTDLEQYKQGFYWNIKKAAGVDSLFPTRMFPCSVINAVIEAHALGNP